MTDSEALTEARALTIVMDIARTTAMKHRDEGRRVLADQIDAALSALGTAPAEGVAWHNISSAPRDGTIFLAREVHKSPSVRPKIYEARYVVANQLSQKLSGEEIRCHNLSANNWAHPTHWMPTPTSTVASPAPVRAGKRCDPSKCLRTDGIVCTDEECDLENGVIRALSEGSANGH